MNLPISSSLRGFQMKLFHYEIWAQRAVACDLELLGCEPREPLRVGKGEPLKAMSLVLGSLGLEPDAIGVVAGPSADVLAERLAVEGAGGRSVGERLAAAVRAVRCGLGAPEVELVPDLATDGTPLIRPLEDQ